MREIRDIYIADNLGSLVDAVNDNTAFIKKAVRKTNRKQVLLFGVGAVAGYLIEKQVVAVSDRVKKLEDEIRELKMELNDRS